jgi:hypothetical protein
MGRLEQAETWRVEKGDRREQQATEELRLLNAFASRSGLRRVEQERRR